MSRTPPKVARPTPAPLTTSSTITALERDAAIDPAATDRFWDEVARTGTPMVEPADEDDHATVTFVWRDAGAAAVLLFANRVTDETDLDASLMRRVPGTDVWHLSYRMRTTWRASYAFVPCAAGSPPPWRVHGDQVALRTALDRGRADPWNRDTCRNRAGVLQSVVALRDAPPQPFLAVRHGVPRGRLEEARGPGGRRVWLHVPPRATAGPPPSEGLPVAVVLDGDVWTSTQDLPTTVDNLAAEGALPATVLLLVDSGDRTTRWADHDDPRGIADHVADELLPWVRERLPVTTDPARTAVVGQSLGGLSALRTAVRRPETVGAAVSQSASLWASELGGDLEGRDLTGSRLYVEVGRHEWVLTAPHRRVVGRLREHGAEVHAVEFDGGHDDACWRGGIAAGLRWWAAGR